jgi:hypothetical protein
MYSVCMLHVQLGKVTVDFKCLVPQWGSVEEGMRGLLLGDLMMEIL